MSLGQLDKAGCHISIKCGLLRILDDQRRLLTQVRCTVNRLYILKLEVEQPVNLSARSRKMEDLLGRGEPPGLAARQLEEEAAEQDVESGGHAARDTEQPVNLSARYRKMEDLLGRGEPPGLRRANSKKRQPNKTWSLEDMPPGTPSHTAQIRIQTK